MQSSTWAVEQRSLNEQSASTTQDNITLLTEDLVSKIQDASRAIIKVNSQTRLLSFNAQIEASRAGGAVGAAFGVVASAIRDLSDKTSTISSTLESEAHRANSTLRNIVEIVETLEQKGRGVRLSDLALANIDLIDRNLYERSCDVRWWAKDVAAVEALTSGHADGYRSCFQRLGYILDAYTVYFDLVLCDLNGIVIANGRPDKYKSVGLDCSKKGWFQVALKTRTGDEFGFQSVYSSKLARDERVVVYACCVRNRGIVNEEPIGVLGVVFNWDALAQTIVTATPLLPEERSNTRALICDQNGVVLADSSKSFIGLDLKLSSWSEIKKRGKGYLTSEFRGKPCTIGFAYSPGYETYRTGWYSLLIQQ